jgi:phospholipase/carboxylesterase
MRRVVALTLLVAVGGCGGERAEETRKPTQTADSPLRFDAPRDGAAKACAPGEHELKVASDRGALMLVTPPANARPRALLVALHGAGSGGAPGGLYAFRGAWRVPGLVILAPAAAGTAWTLEPNDVGFVERSLQRALARCRVDRRRLAIGGFSSGAGMALWLGLTNGDRFRGVIALSGGGSLPEERKGKPHVFVAHGTLDDVIPIKAGGDALARELRGQGYDVTYRRFRGGHRVLPPIARQAVVSTLMR